MISRYVGIGMGARKGPCKKSASRIRLENDPDNIKQGTLTPLIVRPLLSVIGHLGQFVIKIRDR